MRKAGVALALLAPLLLSACGGPAVATRRHSAPPLPVWTVTAYGVALRHPVGWKPAAGYLERIEGKGGYVAVNALQGSGLTPRAAALGQAAQSLAPFGPNPVLRRTAVDGQPGYVIWPAAGQAGDVAEAVVLYPKPQTISGVAYRYLIVTSTPQEILPILRGLRFLGGH